jgi:hypothetical protein
MIAYAIYQTWVAFRKRHNCGQGICFENLLVCAGNVETVSDIFSGVVFTQGFEIIIDGDPLPYSPIDILSQDGV